SALVTVVFALFLVLQAQASDKIEPLEIKQPAPDFDLPGADGKNYSLENFSDAEILVVVFTCNHCPTAQAYEERIKKLVSDYKAKSVAVVAISPNDPKAVRLNELGYSDLSDSLEENKIRAKDHAFNFPYLYDGDTQKVSKLYGPRSTPHVFIFDKERKLRYRGGFDDSENPKRVKNHYVRDALDALLSGKSVPVTDTPTPGCSIKWSDKRESVKEWLEELAAEEVSVNRISPEELKTLLKNETDDLLLVNIWASWCVPCEMEFPNLVTIYRMYRGRDFKMVTVSVDDPSEEEKVLEFLKKQQASCRNTLVDTDDRNALVEATNREWMGAIPFTMLILPGGEIAHRHLGEVEPLELKREIVDILGRTYHK
ncbi:MAG: redoxin domain-containing protein, partial [bacterium]